jgi:hypothetical protein
VTDSVETQLRAKLVEVISTVIRPRLGIIVSDPAFFGKRWFHGDEQPREFFNKINP